jgi:hypothetical protein
MTNIDIFYKSGNQFKLNNLRAFLTTSPPTPLLKARGAWIEVLLSPSPFWERDLG